MSETSVDVLERFNSSTPSKRLAAKLIAPRKWTVEESPIPDPAVGEVRMRMLGCGVCVSGLPMWQGRDWFTYPIEPGQLGHEGWGIVEAFGEHAETSGLKLGDRVAFLADGSYATYVCVAASEVIALPAELEDRPFPAEPVGCAVNVFRRSGIKKGDTVLIVGLGFLGCLLLQLVKDAGAKAVCVTSRPFVRRLADELGAYVTVPMAEAWKVRESLEREGLSEFPVVMECTGYAGGLNVASEFVAERGRLVIAGYHQDGLREVNMQQWNWRGIDVINAHERAPDVYTEGMHEGIRLAAGGALSLDRLLTHRYPLERINEAYQDLEDRPDGFVKGWIDLEGTEP
ncbi:zinc-binding dehydrogenase [Pelagicoccus sp. SDUM812002]|uniref:zinc-binding dehydrogenase n=1 Tax=Pelagicoccus sp. SDUM812002 TaxID=3041266 RepID=UPI00280D10D6|nr:zinc-binding dehydrogenase [Pelagicoccus sp. SDUM812002]MDQ8184114.1 zinc-binding dehydrogenase [Pelagicoccus sp. SDUM812002]